MNANAAELERGLQPKASDPPAQQSHDREQQARKHEWREPHGVGNLLRPSNEL
jgi:hypothetical protein